MMTRVLISLGSNIEKETNIPKAKALIECHPNMNVLKSSETFYFEAEGIDEKQPDYHNAALLIETWLTPQNVKTELQKIEFKMGRRRTAYKFAARPIDIDIAFFGNQIIQEPGLCIPDPDIIKYRHVILPLASIEPDFIHPIYETALACLAKNFGELK